MDKRQASSFYPHFAIEERPTIDQFVGLFNRLLFTGQAFFNGLPGPPAKADHGGDRRRGSHRAGFWRL